MATIEEHYEEFLAPVYSWAFGGLETRVNEFATFFQAHGIRAVPGACALDLGCGSGFQAIPLARAGFEVDAVDLSVTLLEELGRNSAGLPVRRYEAEMLDFLRSSTNHYDLIVCMGDTLTHLPSLDDARSVLALAWARLKTGGSLILSLRDYTHPVTGTARFIPVRAEPDRIFTCFLEYGTDTLAVTDLMHYREKDNWLLKKSTYRKLRVLPDWLDPQLETLGGVTVHRSGDRGQVVRILQKGT